MTDCRVKVLLADRELGKVGVSAHDLQMFVCVCLCLWATPDLHEHAEASLQQVGEASGHVLDVGAFASVRVEGFLYDLSQERTIGRLQSINIEQHT